jgi:hypothetical protein
MRLGEHTDYDYRFAGCDCDFGTDERGAEFFD